MKSFLSHIAVEYLFFLLARHLEELVQSSVVVSCSLLNFQLIVVLAHAYIPKIRL